MAVGTIAVSTLIAAWFSDLNSAPLKSGAVPVPPAPSPPLLPPEEGHWTDVIPELDFDFDSKLPPGGAALLRAAWWFAKNHMKKQLMAMLDEKFIEHAVENKKVWRLFWQKVVKRLGIRGSVAAALVVADGPLPAGDLIALGLSLWTLYDIYVMAVGFFGAE